MELVIERQGPVLTATISGKFIADDAYLLLKQIEDEAAGQRTELIVDIRKLEYIGSQGVSALIKLALSHNLRLVGLPANVKKTFEALGLVKFLKVNLTQEEALKRALKAAESAPGPAASGHRAAAPHAVRHPRTKTRG